MDAIPPYVWAAGGTLIGVVVTTAGNLVIARRTGKREDRNEMQERAVYWRGQAMDDRHENERLYGRNQALHGQVERLLHVNDAVVEQAQTVRTEVANVLRVSGADDAAPEA